MTAFFLGLMVAAVEYACQEVWMEMDMEMEMEMEGIEIWIWMVMMVMMMIVIELGVNASDVRLYGLRRNDTGIRKDSGLPGNNGMDPCDQLHGSSRQNA